MWSTLYSSSPLTVTGSEGGGSKPLTLLPL